MRDVLQLEKEKEKEKEAPKPQPPQSNSVISTVSRTIASFFGRPLPKPPVETREGPPPAKISPVEATPDKTAAPQPAASASPTASQTPSDSKGSPLKRVEHQRSLSSFFGMAPASKKSPVRKPAAAPAVTTDEDVAMEDAEPKTEPPPPPPPLPVPVAPITSFFRTARTAATSAPVQSQRESAEQPQTRLQVW